MSNLYEIDTREDRFIACPDCAYKFLMDLYEGSFILGKPIKGENYSDPDNGVYAAEDFFNEHTEHTCGEAHKCSGCNKEIGG